jgi:SIR2-like domain
MENWLEYGRNREYVQRLRTLLSENDTPVFIFLGAGLSFGVDRGRVMFERDEFEDNRRFPSWPQLIGRMQRSLLSDPMLEPFKDDVNRFFGKESALDCAELFRNYTQGPNYWDFLQQQYGSKPDDIHRLTRSHDGLIRLPIKRIFTTNFDELIEIAYRAQGMQIRVSSSSRDFMDHRAARDTHHLIKLHGTIDQPGTLVLTRSDYARSRRERSEMFRYLTDQFEYASFLFVGFSLLDPNFNILFDEAHYARDGKNPVSYVVQARKDPIREAYLRSLGVNAITLDYWEQLPTFLSAIHPETDLASVPLY